MERPTFNPGRLQPCFCGSGKRFKACCGSSAPDRDPPYGVHIIRGFLAPEERDDLLEWADRQSSEPLQVVDKEASRKDRIELRYSDQRITDKVELGEREATVHGWIKRAIRDVIEPKYACEAAWFEPPTLMRYYPGGIFKMHADSERLIKDRNVWRKIVDRDVSLLMYLNDDYQGGYLSFPVFSFRYKPAAGDLVVFPSDSRYQHEAETLKSGRRYAIASWIALRGVERVLVGPPKGAVHL